MATKKKTEPQIQQKQYIGISRDHSMSMRSIASAAAKDYNNQIDAIKEASDSNDVDTIVSVIRCGCGMTARNEREVVNSNVNRLKPVGTYVADGYSTPLFDSVGELIDLLSLVPDANEPGVSFMVMAITDGEDNSSKKYTAYTLGQKIRQLQGTDRWTFVFRVPKGYKYKLVQMGIPEGNILEWEQTTRGMEVASNITRSAFQSFYASRASGSKSTTKFYADMSNVRPSEVRKEMKNITSEVTFWPVRTRSVIRDFVEKKLGHPMTLGCAFYELTKPEKAVQDYKLICIRNKNSGAVYGGEEARNILGLPTSGDIKLAPGNHGEFDIFVQSTSTNRILMPNTDCLYWPKANTI